MLFWNRDEEGHVWIILGKRAMHHGPGYQQWSLPGGGQEHSDGSFKETAIREAREEIDVKVYDPANVGFLCSVRLPSLFRFEVPEHELKEKTPIKWFCGEFPDVRWFRADQLPWNAMFLTRIEVHSLRKKWKRVGYRSVHSYPVHVCEERPTAFDDVIPCRLEVTGIPRVGDVPSTSRYQVAGLPPFHEVHQPIDFPFRVTTGNTAHVAQVLAIHADQIIEKAIILFRHQPCPFPRGIDAMAKQHISRRWIDRISPSVPDFLARGGRGLDMELVGNPLFQDQVLTEELSHRGAADVAVAYK